MRRATRDSRRELLALVLEFFARLFGLSSLEHVPVSIPFTCLCLKQVIKSIDLIPSPHLTYRLGTLQRILSKRTTQSPLLNSPFPFSLLEHGG
jgi:hypothetical protein